MLSVSEIVAKTEAMFDLFNHHFYNDELTRRYCQELCANTTASLVKLVRRRPNRPRACSAWLPVSGPPVVRQGWRSHLRSP